MQYVSKRDEKQLIMNLTLVFPIILVLVDEEAGTTTVKQ